MSGITLDDNVENFPDLSHISGIKQKVGELDRVLFDRTGIPSLQKLQMMRWKMQKEWFRNWKLILYLPKTKSENMNEREMMRDTGLRNCKVF